MVWLGCATASWIEGHFVRALNHKVSGVGVVHLDYESFYIEIA